MARISHSEHLVTASGRGQCLESTKRDLLRTGGAIEQETDSRVVARSGSPAGTRLLGDVFLSESTLPKLVQIDVGADPAAGRVSITAEEALGFGILVGITDKYRAR